MRERDKQTENKPKLEREIEREYLGRSRNREQFIQIYMTC